MGVLIELASHRKTEQWSLLWREALGDQLREERVGRGERIVDVAKRSGVSQQYGGGR